MELAAGISDAQSSEQNSSIPAQHNESKDEGHADSSASESEHQHALEVVFDADNLYRRKSSMVVNKNGGKERKDRTTACFLHQFLESRKAGRGKVTEMKQLSEEKQDDKSPSLPESGLHSRLLTKRQLLDMASEIRDLSKKLGSVKLKLHVKTVFLLTKAHDETLIDLTREIADWLLSKDRDTPYIVYVEDTLEHNKKFNALDLVSQEHSREGRLKYWNNELCAKHPHTFDFAITLGGDGTLLYASWLFQRIVPPVLSLSLGSLGFLTKFDYETFRETLTNAFRDGIIVSLRLRFEGTVMRSQKTDKSAGGDLVDELIGEESEHEHTHKPDGTYQILNDIVVDRGPNPTMSSIEVFGDDEHFTTVQADGICVATPTGSTAYNLAAGGSLCHPENPVILVTAICAHTLSFRPIILPDTIVLRIGVPYDARTSCWASFDGRERVELCAGDYVTISASRYPFANIMPQGRRSEDWVSSISQKLNWNSRQRQKSFKEWSKD